MRAKRRSILAIVLLAAMAACGSYSAPSGPTGTGADSTHDSTGMSPAPTYP
jgi:hypothetical protein